ncbi:hypothetical protein N9I69_02600 [Planktomarina temperata]|nr:hypothetical protein [Planktomarina temperata]
MNTDTPERVTLIPIERIGHASRIGNRLNASEDAPGRSEHR